MKTVWIRAACLALGMAGFGAATARAAEDVELCRGQYQTPEEGKAQLERLSATWSDQAGWEQRAGSLRTHILHGAGLDPLPPRCNLAPVYRNRREHDGYTAENVAIQVLPGYYLRGALYRPAKPAANMPGILSAHGHFRGPDKSTAEGSGRFGPVQQIRAAMLARMGAVVFSYEMLGYAESGRDLPFEKFSHGHPDVLSYNLWSGIRALDFLLSLEGVDPKRIGMTGASGGGTQTFLLTAVDDRIKASAPVVMVSSHFFGGCNCESGKPIHKSAHHETNNAEIAALAAPRPQLVVSVGADWTHAVPEIEYPFLQSVYGVYDATDRVENVHLADEQHDYGPSKRAAMYWFFVRHFQLDPGDRDRSDGSFDETGAVVEDSEALVVFSDPASLPPGFIRGGELGRFAEFLP